ncbi:MAG TPA: choice-of-anchor D domain-containing protein [Verrucomicrobiales bacterium]|nr:choice-of-anchor D domain-containing protein [Verrucomicrobiales bacterium]
MIDSSPVVPVFCVTVQMKFLSILKISSRSIIGHFVKVNLGDLHFLVAVFLFSQQMRRLITLVLPVLLYFNAGTMHADIDTGFAGNWITDTWTTIGRPQDPDKAASDGSWNANAPDIVGSADYPYLQYRYNTAKTAIQLKVRIEKLSSIAELKVQSANTLFDFDADGIPEFVLILKVTPGTGANNFDESDSNDYTAASGIVNDNTYSVRVYFKPLKDDGTANANTSPSTTTIAVQEEFLIYDTSNNKSGNDIKSEIVGDSYATLAQIRFALDSYTSPASATDENDIDGDLTTENYYTLRFDLAAYSTFATKMAALSNYNIFQTLVTSWPTTGTLYGATVSATQDNRVNGDIGGGGFTGSETWASINGSNVEINIKGNNTDITDGDSTPVTGDHTDFGSHDIATGTQPRTFTISNSGSGDLSLSGTPIVAISGTHASDFTVSTQPDATTVSAGGTKTFVVTFDPGATGLRNATVSMANDDSDENPYTFAIAGTGTSVPEIGLSGNSVNIADGDSSATTSDHTDFGSHDVSTGSQTRTFTISNTGNADLNLTGTPIVTIIGSSASDFTVTTQPDATTVSASGSKTFVVIFDPTAIGLREATISITSNDADEATYTFAIQGNSTSAGSPLACVANFFQIYGNTGIIAYLDATTDPYTYTTIGTAGYKVNAVGYNIEDGFLYGQARTGPHKNKFLKIDSAGSITILNSITDTFLSVVADFNTSGDLYMFQQSPGKVGILDVSAGTITEHDLTGETLTAKDMAYRHSDGIFYGVTNFELYAYNPNTHNVTKQTISGILREDIDNSVSGSTFGAAWTATDDYLYVGNNNSGRMYKINISNLSSVYVGQAIASGQNDGASCSRASSPLPSTGKIGNQLWVDVDNDGIQDIGEGGLSGVSVSIYDGDDTLLNSYTTDSNGAYLFENLAPSQYYLKINSVPSGYAITSKDAGSDDDVDNDFDPATSRTELIAIGVGVTNNSVDLGLRQVPEIALSGNSTNIADGDTSAISSDHTDFGSHDIATGSQPRTFTISNSGSGDLSLSGTPIVAVSGTNASEFTVTTQPDATTVSASGSKTFVVTFDPGATGTRSATVSIANDDSDENPYTFAIAGTGTLAPEIALSGNSTNIADGDTSAISSDHTDFGSHDIATGSQCDSQHCQ